ncbi:MAG: M42 family metallopeptidase [Clostridiales bacterium]|nr:M42 family metallopeptidase [Clostridiales bacterium]
MGLRETIREFMLAPAPSGYESCMAALLKARLEKHCDEVRIDRAGNCIGRIAGTASAPLRAMVFAHMDELGFIVRRVNPDGTIQVDRLGGIPEKALPGLEVLLRGEDGSWHPGVIGVKSHHATPAEEKYRVDPVTSVWIDIGAQSDSDVNRINIFAGCPAVYRPTFRELEGTRVAGTSVDDRGGCACLTDIAARLAAERPRCDVYIVGTVWEEFNLRGAMLAARAIRPDLALSLDVTLAGDTRDLAERFDVRLGEGPCVQLYSFHGRGTLNGAIANEPLFRLAKKAAGECAIPLQRFSALGLLTDAAYVQLEGEGVACLEMGFPARYTHSPVEVCDLNDIEGLSRLVSAMLVTLDDGYDLSRY